MTKRAATVVAVLTTVLALPVAASAAVQARQADAFVDSIGVGVHLAYSDTPYVSEFAIVRGKRGRSARVVKQWPRPGRLLAQDASVSVKIRLDD